MGFTAATSAMFAPNELFEALDIPFAIVLNTGDQVDVSEYVIFDRCSPDDVRVTACCIHGNLIQLTVPGRHLPELLLTELEAQPAMALTITNALYWLPTGTVFAVSCEAVLMGVEGA
jgi:hypothetical protein